MTKTTTGMTDKAPDPGTLRDRQTEVEIEAIIDGRRSDYVSIRRQILLFEAPATDSRAKEWVVLYGRVTAVGRDAKPPKPLHLNYGQYIYEQDLLDLNQARRFFADLLLRAKLVIANVKVAIALPINFTVTYETSRSSYSHIKVPYPHLWYRTRLNQAVRNVSYGPLLVNGLPAFPNIRVLASEYFGLDDDTSSSWMGEFDVVLPRFGARISSFEVRGRRIATRLLLADPKSGNYTLRLWACRANDHHHADIDVTGERCTFRLPWTPDRVMLFLVDSTSGQLVDQSKEYRPEHGALAKPRTPEEWKKLILEDETQTLEFKSYRDPKKNGPGPSLASELHTDDMAAAMTAFANTNEGTILVGVEDDRTIVGVDDARKAKAIATEVAHNNCVPPITPRFFTIHFKRPNATVVGIEVKPDGRVHQTNRRQIYVRRGASCRHATPSEIERIATLGSHDPF